MRGKFMKLSVIMPVYNEARYVDEIIRKVLSSDIGDIKKEIIIIESNSTDGSRDLVKKYENRPEFTIIYEEKPEGKGHAVRKGLTLATGDIILIQDADLEYNPDEYHILLKPLVEGKAKFVLGSRHMGNSGWAYRKFSEDFPTAFVYNIGTRIFDFCFNFLYGVRLTDPMTMYKVFRKECLEGIEFQSDYFDLDLEIVTRFIKKGFIPVEVPVSYVSRSFSEGKKVVFYKVAIKVLIVVIKYRFRD
jgi:glycosyltransferase involved in cell wall biosynthesis